ncbi:MAG: rhamnogalacturonan lyase [Prevotellaceae bacterium]|nr:rhamnogalacturonan lyase [Prevotellaceae bacterium]
MKTISVFVLLCLVSVYVKAQPKYDRQMIKMEKLNRGVVALREDDSTVVVSWRYLSSDPMNVGFNVYRNNAKVAYINDNEGTFFKDKYSGKEMAVYSVAPVVDGKECGKESFVLPLEAPSGYVNIPLERPDGGVTPDGQKYTYFPGDASIGDVDGDGSYEIILKWDPTNLHDNSHDGYTGNVYIDCYRINGEKLWRIDLGRNIRAGAHYTQFMVYDLDCDGKAEVVMKTADGTKDGVGKIIGDANADYVGTTGRLRGRIVTGPEYLTVFNGLTGKAMFTSDYIPSRGNPMDWGDAHGNRSDRFLACVAYLDGIHPSVVMCRGYYTRTVLAAYDWDGHELKKRWVFDTNEKGNNIYARQGNHNLRVADVDGDGCDEIVYGSMTVDNDGKGLYSTCLGHGDAMHLTQFDPDSPNLQVWACHENRKDGSTFRDAATGKIIFQIKDSTDVGRCMAADIDPASKGVEMWSLASGGIRSIAGELLASDVSGLSYNMAVWWDGDLSRELLDWNRISKYDSKTKCCNIIKVFDGCVSINGTKAVPCLQGDIIGDWREEVLLPTEDGSSLHLYISTVPTDYRFHTFLEDPVYRISIATENVGYNQPTQPGFYFGTDLKGIFRGCKIK